MITGSAFPQVRDDVWSGAGSNRRPSAFQLSSGRRTSATRFSDAWKSAFGHSSQTKTGILATGTSWACWPIAAMMACLRQRRPRQRLARRRFLMLAMVTGPLLAPSPPLKPPPSISARTSPRSSTSSKTRTRHRCRARPAVYPRQPVRPTPRGAALLHALTRPEVGKLLSALGPD